jgi:hypothetical protein
MCIDDIRHESIHAKGVDAIVEEVKNLVDEISSSKGKLSKEFKEAEKIQQSLDYILNESCSEKVFPNGVRDQGRPKGMKLHDFMKDEHVTKAGLEKKHVVALRLYTTIAYRKINNPLRDQARFDRGEPHPLPATVTFLRDAILKLRGTEKMTTSATTSTGKTPTLSSSSLFSSSSEKVFWRGIKEVHLTDEFIRTGGAELAPMSTTSDLSVAMRYGSCENGSVLFRIVVRDEMMHGADLSWVSAFPGDKEVLYPPLTFLRPNDIKEVQDVVCKESGVRIKIIEVSPDLSANQ